MRFTTLLFLSISLLAVTSCDGLRSRQNQFSIRPVAENEQLAKAQLEDRAATKSFNQNAVDNPGQITTNVSLNQADAANAAAQAIARKIIRDANLTIEVSSPADSQRKIFSVAEAHGGFVVTSEMTQQTSDDKSKPELSVNLIVRVPAAEFDRAMEEIRAVASRVVQEKRTGKDVTEEFIDLEARMKNQKALEAQFLEVMKRAGKVEDALEVQRQLADVRT